VALLKYQAKRSDKVLLIDSIVNVIVAWAGQHPVYLQLTGTSKKQQLFMLRVGLHSLKKNGYEVDVL